MKWRKQKDKKEEHKLEKYPEIEVTIQQVRKAIAAFSDQLPKGVTRSILVKEDNQIDFQLLAPFLRGIPNCAFYMSKETYEVFEEADRNIPVYTDIVQVAVDRYIEIEKEAPIISGDPYRKISYYLLEKTGFLKERPPIDFYLTDHEFLITHKKPA